MPQFPDLRPFSGEQDYPNSPDSGYSVIMSVDLSQSFLSPSMLLWLSSVLVAVFLMLSLMNRRRTKLTNSLREFVDKNNLTTGNKNNPMVGDSPPSEEDTSD